MTLLRVDATIQGDRSASSALADLVIAEFSAMRPDAPVVNRHLGADPLPAHAWEAAISSQWTPVADRSPTQVDALALAEQLAGELERAERAVLALPLYNYGISQHVKTWIDLALAGAPHGSRLLDGKPVVVVTTRGGAYGSGTPREGWDHNTAYLHRIIADVWGADLTLVERELTLVGVNPALDEFAEAAEVMRVSAEAAASRAGVSPLTGTPRHAA